MGHAAPTVSTVRAAFCQNARMTTREHSPIAGAASECSRPMSRSTMLVVAAVLVVAGVAALAIDVPVATWCKTHRLPGEIGRLINLLEISGHSLGAAIMLIAAVVLDRSLAVPGPGRFGVAERAFARMVAATYLGGLIVDLIKISVERVRPRAADLATLTSPFATFGDASLAATAPRATDLMSFPSGHSAVAAGLAAALAWRYPRGLPLFMVLAAATALQRVVSSAHYPSDTAFGAAVGIVAAAACLGSGTPPAATLAGSEAA